MRLLDAGISQPYLHANMKMKEDALNRTTPTNVESGRYHATDELLTFLSGL